MKIFGYEQVSCTFLNVRGGSARDQKHAIMRGLQVGMTPTTPRTGVTPCRSASTIKDVQSVCGKVEHMAADGAADVQLATRELATNLTLAGPTVEELHGCLENDLPNIKASSRDRSHACQRTHVLIGH